VKKQMIVPKWKKRTDGVSQVVEHQPSKYETLSSNSSSTKKKKKERKTVRAKLEG
jgi:hypothetical protein